MNEAQYRIIETMGLNPEDNREFIAGFENPVAAAETFFALIPKMWPMEWSELSHETAEEWRDALITYAAMTSPGVENRTGVACIAILPDGTRRRAILPDADPSIVVAVEGVMDAAGPVIIARADDGTTLEFHLPDDGPFISVINAQLRAAGAGFSVIERDEPAPNDRPAYVYTGPTVY